MSRTIPDQRLEILHGEIRSKVHKRPGAIWVEVEGHELSCILDELRRRRQATGPKGFAYSATTRILIGMAVGDTVILPPITMSALTTNRATARKALNTPDARWHAEAMTDNHVRVTRMPDGSPHIYGRPRNPAVAQLAAMNVDDVATVWGAMTHAIKVQARQAANRPYMEFRCERLTTGNTRVRRTR